MQDGGLSGKGGSCLAVVWGRSLAKPLSVALQLPLVTPLDTPRRRFSDHYYLGPLVSAGAHTRCVWLDGLN
jgi:hypothetical protein